MRWNFIDRLAGFKEWKEIAAVKAVSLEEYHLLERFGRKGELPQSIVLESCVELAGWLVAKSSSFVLTCVLAEVDTFRFLESVGAGDVLMISLSVLHRDTTRMRTECSARSAKGEVARGILRFTIVPLAEFFDREVTEGMWKEMYAAS